MDSGASIGIVSFSNLFIGTNLLASQGNVSGNSYANVASLHTSTYPSYVTFVSEAAWWQAFSTLNYAGTDIALVSYASSLELAIFKFIKKKEKRRVRKLTKRKLGNQIT